MTKRFLPVLLALALAGCALPRGAAMQGEILANTDTEARDLQVMPVTRATQATIAAWPLPARARAGHAAWPRAGLRHGDGITIASGDTLSMTIWDNEENSLLTAPTQKSAALSETTVAGDGTIFLPYVGKVEVRGLSADQARDRLQARLAEVLPSAQLQLQTRPGRGNTVDLVSGVARAGKYPLPDRNYSVLSLISEGGGVNTTLKNPVVKLIRGGTAHGIGLQRLFATPALDVSLRGGDKVLIEEDPRSFVVLGAAGRQSSVAFDRDPLTALDAISLAGGANPGRANLKGVLILREYAAGQVRGDGRGPDRNRVVFTIDMTTADGLFSAGNFHIADGDLVLLTESPLTNTRTVFGLLGQLFGIVDQVNGN